MPFIPLPPVRPKPDPEPPCLVRYVGREDVLWNRPVFRAPPLQFDPKHLDRQKLAEDLRRIAMGER